MSRTGRTLADLATQIPMLPQQQRTIPARHKDQWEGDPVLHRAIASGGVPPRFGRPRPRPTLRHGAGNSGHGGGLGRSPRGRAGRRTRGAGRRAAKLAPFAGAPSPASGGQGHGRGDRERSHHMCGIVGYTGPREAGPSCWMGFGVSSTAATTRPASPWSPRAASSSWRRGPARSRSSRTLSAASRPGPDRDSATPAGPLTAAPATSTPIPTATAPAASRSSTTASSRTSASCATSWSAGGHVLASETDTEVVAHLVEDAYEGDLADAVRAALGRLEGAYALVVMHGDEPDRLVGARLNAPLIVGVGDGESFLASDAAALVAYTKRVIFLADGDVADLRPGQVVITDIAGRPRRSADRRDPLVGRGGREGRLRPLHAQGDPRAARGTAIGYGRSRCAATPSASRRSMPIRDRLVNVERVELIACGTRLLRLAGRRGSSSRSGWASPPGPTSPPSSATARRRSMPERWSWP